MASSVSEENRSYKADSASSEDSDESKKNISKENPENQSSTTITTVVELKDDQDKNEPMKQEPDEEVSMSYIDDLDKPICGICLKDETSNKKGEPEDLISCSQCDNYGHPSCLDMSKDLVSVIVTYNWQCLECKTCTYCSKPHHEDKMMFCDRCDRGYHTFCVGLRNLPSGLWMCPQCTRSDPDFSKLGGGKRASTGTPRKRKPETTQPSPAADTPSKPKRKRRTKKEMEEAREKERLEKEEKQKIKMEQMIKNENPVGSSVTSMANQLVVPKPVPTDSNISIKQVDNSNATSE